MEIRFAKQARRHKIGRAHALYIMRGEPVEATRPTGEVELSWVGPDGTGRELRVIGVVTTHTRTGRQMVLVIHVMPTALERRRMK